MPTRPTTPRVPVTADLSITDSAAHGGPAAMRAADLGAAGPTRAMAAAGLALTGLGLCLVTDASHRRARGHSWRLRGTSGLCAVGAGLSLLGDAVKRLAVAEASRR